MGHPLSAFIYEIVKIINTLCRMKFECSPEDISEVVSTNIVYLKEFFSCLLIILCRSNMLQVKYGERLLV